ncbi:uncharacterized protein METZ01_LOCUS201801, partial [marine metagenome]
GSVDDERWHALDSNAPTGFVRELGQVDRPRNGHTNRPLQGYRESQL